MSTSPEIIFQPSTIQWEGIGINCRVDDVATMANQTQNMNIPWCRFFLEIDDPGPDGIYFDDDTFDRLWEASENIQTQTARFTYSSLEVTGTKFIFSQRGAPQSWLTTDGNNELRGDALVGFARMFASAIKTYKKYGMPTQWIEICDEPSTTNNTYLTPDNYVVLVRTLKSFLAYRELSSVKIMGPGLSYIMSKFQSVEPYIDAFKETVNLLDAWSIHVLENKVDSNVINSGTFEARKYVQEQLQKTTNFMKWTLPSLPIYVTKFATNATRFSQGIDYGHGAPETIEYATRLLDNFCGIVNSGASSALSWFLTYKYDNKALFRSDGSRRPQRDALALLNKALPSTGTIYLPVAELPADIDQTLKAFVVSRNSFGFVLSRSHLIDGSAGQLQIKIRNPNWKNMTFTSTMSLSCFPNYVSLSGIEKSISVDNGDLILSFTELPYNCVIFGKGDVYALPVLAAPPTPYSAFDIPRVSDLTNLTVVNEGDIIYNVQSKSLLIYSSGSWKPARVYSGNNAVLLDDTGSG